MYGQIQYIIVEFTEILRTFAEKIKIMNSTTAEQARFDARLPKEQKEFFEKAAFLGGYRNLTDFVIRVVQEKAKEIVKEREQIIASERDSQIFFNAISNPQKPSENLKKALEDYNSFIANSK